jgi:2-oxo-4-hydroxy-4-carboxy-5-ureidoimidazoline decarboxylase
MTLEQLNQMDSPAFVLALGAIFEHSPWVAAGAWEGQPFESLEQLHTQMVTVVEAAPHSNQLELIRAHPDLGSRAKMADASIQEQKGAGLDSLSAEEYERLLALNTQYKTKFDFPFILAVKGKTKQDILDSLAGRLSNSPEAEFARALQEIYTIAQFRLQALVEGYRP